MKISPALKGIITAVIVMAIVLITYYSGMPADSPFQYMIYLAYVSGIAWAVIGYRFSDNFSGRFWDSFIQGFRCFVVVILLITLFTVVFNVMHPEFKNELAEAYRAQLLKDNSKTPDNIITEVSRYKKNYITMLVYGSIIGYLIIGAGVTAAISAFIPKRN